MIRILLVANIAAMLLMLYQWAKMNNFQMSQTATPTNNLLIRNDDNEEKKDDAKLELTEQRQINSSRVSGNQYALFTEQHTGDSNRLRQSSDGVEYIDDLSNLSSEGRVRTGYTKVGKYYRLRSGATFYAASSHDNEKKRGTDLDVDHTCNSIV